MNKILILANYDVGLYKFRKELIEKLLIEKYEVYISLPNGEYIQNMSFWFDLKCFFGTFISILKSDGVVEGGTGTLEKNKSSID